MRGKEAIVLAVVLAIAMVGCGQSTAKRAVDARTEVLRFFAVDAPVVAVLRPEPAAGVVALDRAAADVPLWTSLRSMVLGPLYAAGLGRAHLARLVRPGAEIEGIDAAALALGAETPAALAAHRSLLVLATDQAELLSELLRRSADAGQLQRVGRLDEATLYRNPVASYGVRDGVLVSAARLADVRAAIERRDGDSDQQLDEDIVQSLFNDLEAQGPLLVYADLDGVRKADPGLRTLGQVAPWTGMLGPTAASARAVDGSMQIEDFSKATGDGFGSSDLPIGTEPSRFEINASVAASLIPFEGPIRTLLSDLGPVTGEATATSDEVRLHVTAGG